MAFESTKATLKQNKLFTSTKVEVVKEVDVDFNIDKILSVKAMSRVLSKECNDGLVKIVGKTKIDLITLVGNEIKTVFQDVEWTKNVEASLIGEPVIIIKEEMVGFELLEKPLVKIDVNLDVYGAVMDVMPSINIDDDSIVLKEQNNTIQSIVGNVFNTFTLTQEFEEVTSYEILSKEAKINKTNVVCGVDAYIVEGVVEVCIQAKESDKYMEIKKEIAFKQELPFAQMLPTHKIINRLKISTLMATISQKDEKQTLLIALDVDDNAIAIMEQDVKTLADVYCLTNTIETSEECIKVVEKNEVVVRQQQITAISELDEVVQDILFVSNCNVENVKVVEDSVVGNFVCDVIFRSADDIVNCVKQNQAFSVELNQKTDNEILDVNVSLLAARLKYGNQIEVSASLEVSVNEVKNSYLVYVTEVNKKEEVERSEAAMQVYVVKENEDLFDVGKALGVTIDQIKAQNENIENVIAGQKIIIYNKLTAEN